MADVIRGIPITSAGTKVCYAIETTAGTMPTNVKFIPDIKEIPDLNPQPESLETTDLSCTKYKTFTDGLIDLSGASTYVANLTTLLENEWETMCDAYDTAKEDGKKLWIYIIPKGGLKAVAYTASPSRLGVSSQQVSSVLEINVYLTPNGEPERVDASTLTVTYPQAV